MTPTNETKNTTSTKGLHPKLVFLSSLIVPGSGHVLQGMAKRGLQFLFFMIVFTWVGNRLFPELSFFARHSGGILLYGLIAIDAYGIAMRRRHGID